MASIWLQDVLKLLEPMLATTQIPRGERERASILLSVVYWHRIIWDGLEWEKINHVCQGSVLLVDCFRIGETL